MSWFLRDCATPNCMSHYNFKLNKPITHNNKIVNLNSWPMWRFSLISTDSSIPVLKKLPGKVFTRPFLAWSKESLVDPSNYVPHSHPPVRQTPDPGDLGPVGSCQKWSVQLALTHHFLIKLFEAPLQSAAC